MKTRYLVSASSSAGAAESTTEESSGETYVNPVQQLKGKEKKVSLLVQGSKLRRSNFFGLILVAQFQTNRD
jgi:hypothetical protein